MVMIIINTSAVSQTETSIESNEDATKYVGDVLLTEFGKEFATTERVGENVVTDDVMINTSAVSQTRTSVESEDTTEFVEENVDGVFSQEDVETQLSNEDESIQVHHHKLPSMKENVDDALSLEDDEAESASEVESLETEATNVTTISTYAEDNHDNTQTNSQSEETVEQIEISPSIEYVKSEHENEDVFSEEDTISQTEICDDDKKLQSERKEAPLVDQPNVVFPAAFMNFDTNIQFGSFNCLNETKSVLLNPEIEPKCFTNPKIPEPVLTDLRESDNDVIYEGVDNDGRSCKDAFLEEITVKWASMKVLKESLNSMNVELMAAKQLLKSKRQQIDHIKQVINKVKNAIAVEDIDKRDLNMELETLKDEVIKAQVARNTLSNKYDEERDMEKELWARFVAAEDSCKEDLPLHLYSLEKHLNEEFERYMDEWDTYEEFGRYNMFAINSGPTLDEVKSMSEVTHLKTPKTVKSIEGKHPNDQINENVLEEVEPIMKTEETYELTKEDMETMLKEKIHIDKEIKEIKAQVRKKINALKTQKRANYEAQKEAQQQEKWRLRRLRKRENKRASLERKRALAAEDAASNNVNDEIVVESNKSNEFEKQPKPTITNKNLWTHQGNMIITFVVLVLWVFYILYRPPIENLTSFRSDTSN